MMRSGGGKSVSRLAVLRKHLCPNGQSTMLMPVDTCGIVAYIGEQEQAVDFLMEGLRVLEPRGYDSAGITTIDKEARELVTSKYASLETTSNAISKLEKSISQHANHKVGIAHTRWATHGARTQENAHPHLDHENRIAIVHNGVIENNVELRQELLEKYGIKCRSETDSEVIAQLIGQYVKEGDSLLDAVNRTQDKLQGTWGLAILDRENPNMLIAAKNGSPLLVGIGEDKMFIGSEPAAFSKHTKEYIALEDGEVAVLTTKGHSLDRRRIEVAPTEKLPKSPDPYPWWTIKEIMEQPAAISRALNYGGRLYDENTVKLGGLEANRDVLTTVSHLVIAACGTSYFAAMAGAMFMRFMNAFKTVQVIDAAELGPEVFPREGAGLLVISQSGETKDVHRALHIAQSMDIPCMSVVNVVGSLIARSTNCGVYLNAGREFAVASTKAFTCQVTVLSLIAIWFSQIHTGTDKMKRKTMVDSLHRLPTNVGMALRMIQKPCQEVARKVLDSKWDHMFILGKGFALPIALEGALKIKEISYIHAEGYPGGALKHGPYALIDKGMPIILIILDDRHASKMKTVAEEVKARGAIVIIITNKPEMFTKSDGDVIPIPSNGILTSLLAVLPLQMLAYELSIGKGLDPDRPKHLAKTVTVD